MPRACSAGLLTLVTLTGALGATPEDRSPSNQEVLTFIADTIDWYRRLPSVGQVGMEPRDILFVEDNQPLATEIVRLSFEFGKGVAALQPAGAADADDGTSSRAGNNSLQFLIAARTKLDGNMQQTLSELHSAEAARLAARGPDRTTLDKQISELRRRAQLLGSISADYANILGFARDTSADGGRMTSLSALIENLERTVPSISGAESPQTAVPAASSHGLSGIKGLIFRVSALSKNEQEIESVIDRTAALGASLKDLRTAFAKPFRQQVSTLALDASSLDVLQQQESRVATLVSQAKAASPAITALIRLHGLLDLFAAHLSHRRAEIESDERIAWKALLIRLGMLVATIIVIVLVGKVANRAAERHLHEADTREMFRVGIRFLIWLIIAITLVSTFAFNLSSLATFLGLLSAGLAVGLHDVFLSLAGYLLIVRKFHVRLGDRVQISGVTGEVTKLGLMDFELGEIEAATGKRTGRIVFFSNSYVFVSPATPLFRQLSA